MKGQKIIGFIRYFTFLTFVFSSVIIAFIYFLPTNNLVDYSVLYGLGFGVSTLILICIVVYRIITGRGNRRKFLPALILLVLNLVIAIVYTFIWNYATGTILIKIINNTDKDVSNAGIYDCSRENWGILKSGESRTVRFHHDGCTIMVTYKLEGIVRHEILPGKFIIRNVYLLGTHPNIEMEE